MARTSGHTQLDAARRLTRQRQSSAADPAVSAWVSANAGTGKTHVLTNRVVRLLLAGTSPERILCLTYTKAAAAEMASRVFERLARWVTADDATLTHELTELQTRTPTPDELQRARDLFTVAIETPGGLKVQTIHAFCERLLQRFPLEAGVAPQFAILDEETGRALRQEATLGALEAATTDPQSALGRALDFAVTYAVDDGFDALLAEALGRRDWLEAAGRLIAGGTPEEGLAAAEVHYRQVLGVRPGATVSSIEAEICALLTDRDLAACHSALLDGSKSDADLAPLLSSARAAGSATARVRNLALFFRTADGEGGARKRLMTTKLAAEHPQLATLLAETQTRFIRLHDERAALPVLQGTMALLVLGEAVRQRYTELKRRRAALDFDDLIVATRRLLSTAESAQWVLYKLDGGLDHILVDEAQDTGPDPWSIIESLAREFFAGEGSDDRAGRTLFAVGDEKQSIYGFQGAAPEMFAAMGEKFSELATRAGRRWEPVPLTLSFRTVAPILDAVDRVFEGAAAQGLTASGDVVRHAAHRLGAAGLVEIWDTEKAAPVDAGHVWSLFDDAAPASPVVALAERIARTIDGWLKNGEHLASENRPVRAGDILILVRKRAPFAPLMVAALKSLGIPVAGADRMAITGQLAVQDLLALADFLLLPEDDLALATVLKSPLFGLDDNDLLDFAPKRSGSLWSSLLGASRNHPRLVPAAETLKRWRGRADLMPPYEFFVEVLDRDRMRARFLTRLGPEAADPIDAFQNLALTWDDGAPPSLQGFVDWLRGSDRAIKRDMEHGRNEVRVMTVHGAKGLEAPIVFLPDTCTTRSGQRPGALLRIPPPQLAEPQPEPFLWPLKGSKNLQAILAARSTAADREMRERNRLLYVALTRPRDRLYIAGFEGAKGRAAGCWYDLIVDALAPALTETVDANGVAIRRLSSSQETEPEKPRERGAPPPEPLPLPDWALRPAPKEAGLVMPLAPSRLAPLETDEDGEPVEPTRDPKAEPRRAPAHARADGPRFLRGTLTHALLQHLPGLSHDGWEAAATGFIETRGRELKPATRRSIVAETLAVLREPEFAPIFGRTSRAEVPIVAEITGPKGEIVRVNGQLDRVVQLDGQVLIVDYKTNRPPPRRSEEVTETYLLQLAAYRMAVRQVFGGLPVRAALLWTDGPDLMPIPDTILDAAEQRLFEAARA